MGQMRFLVSPAGRLTADRAARAYVSGPDLVPWLGKVSLEPAGEGLARLVIERGLAESGHLHVPWVVGELGELMLTTSTLMEREVPYVLALELARGKLNQVRNQLGEWQAIGLTSPRELSDKLQLAHRQFAEAATRQHDPAAASWLADVALATTLEVADLLARAYTDQALAARRRQSGKLTTLLAAQLGAGVPSEASGKRLLGAINAAHVLIPWREMEATEGRYKWEAFDAQVNWCHDHALSVTAGPLLQMDAAGLPDWLYLWEGDFDNLLSFVSDYVETMVTRYRGRVGSWVCAGRANAAESLGLSEEDRLRLVARSIELAHQLDPDTPCVLRIDQPWAEFLARLDFDLSPLHLADTLLRAGLGLNEIELELNVGWLPGGSARRDLLDMSRLLDLWSCLGVPLRVVISCPSGERPDAQATSHSHPVAPGPAGSWNAVAQQRFVERVVSLLLAKPAVKVVTWAHVFDSQPHEFPWPGLFDATGHPKPALASLAALRRVHLL